MSMRLFIVPRVKAMSTCLPSLGLNVFMAGLRLLNTALSAESWPVSGLDNVIACDCDNDMLP